MKKKIILENLPIQENLKKNIPLFYHFISYNKLVPGDPFALTELSEETQSLVFFGKPEKPVSKMINMEEPII